MNQEFINTIKQAIPDMYINTTYIEDGEMSIRIWNEDHFYLAIQCSGSNKYKLVLYHSYRNLYYWVYKFPLSLLSLINIIKEIISYCILIGSDKLWDYWESRSLSLYNNWECENIY